jgi:putative flavoprotein involved in K+ transport
VSTVVIGAGQAGLAVSRGLSELGVEHVVLERASVAQAWRDRWDSFTLVTPNWTLGLPGSPFAGDDPEGHVARDGIVAYLEAYAAGAPIREGVRVDALRAGPAGDFRLSTSAGDIDASTVVVCTGAYQRPFRPAAVSGLPVGVLVMDANDYRNPQALPDGQVLVIGSGQTGCQLAEELHLVGRDVFLCCGRAPWAPRRLDGLDVITWLTRAGFYDETLAQLPSPAARLAANVQTTGAGGGHDLHYRTLQSLGVPLLGRLAHVDGNRASFTDDLGASVAFGDARWADMCQLMRAQLPARGYPVPELPAPAPFSYDPVHELDLRAVGTVIVSSGYRPDYSWIDFPVADPMGFPVSVDGASTIVPGLYFCGVHFLRTRRSSLLFGVGEDAAIVGRLAAEAEQAHRETAPFQ